MDLAMCRRTAQVSRHTLLQKDGYISTSDIKEEEDEDIDEEGGEVLGDEATTAYRSIIVLWVLNLEVQQPQKLQRHNLFQIFFVISNR